MSRSGGGKRRKNKSEKHETEKKMETCVIYERFRVGAEKTEKRRKKKEKVLKVSLI